MAVRYRGFSIAELVIVLVLSGFVMAIVSPAISSVFKRKATTVAADGFVTTHGLARSAAVRYGQVAGLHIDAANARFWVEVDTSSSGGVTDTVGIVKDFGSMNVAVTSDRSLICFDVRGLPTARGACQPADATLTFSFDDGSFSAEADTLKITALGKVLR